MNRLSRITVLSLLLAAPQVFAAPADAQRIQKTYQLKLDNWSLEMRVATTPEQRQKAWNSRPDATPAAREMWTAIGSSLDQDWTLAPAAWFLRTTPGLLATDATGVPKPIFGKEIEAIRKAIETYHLKSPKIAPVCGALAFSNDPRSLAVLEKIESGHPDPKIQGLAALGAAMQLKTLGDDGEIMRKRLTLLRKAIIQSSDVDLDGTTVAKRAEDELYIIRFLTKGRVAPNLVGTDSAGRALSLEAHKGKIVVLLFWNSNVPDAKRVVEITTAMEVKFRGDPVVFIGVNNDPLEKLRTLQADGTVPWTNFSDPENKLAVEYRVGVWPLAYVLDGERKVHYAGAPGSFVELTAAALLEEMKTGAKPAKPGR
ncbi:TlpA family protein disulfide reductase [Luteolibacter yonseiensis]|uniref:TlpA family protein disulfide reductase n=1 Tax=Luteolibacter yonseiensis TaxID=1144680 RepID=A0A934R2L3_9BACT|nr:TlpA disulfide reductase family protein [Luteolibacter yonseiensis]MBK1817248.1 TlpA family protein disulfide reductase [Luteolibacter yonseiensis]